MTDNELLIATAKATQSQEWQDMWLDKHTSIWPWNPFRYKGDAFALIEGHRLPIDPFDTEEWSDLKPGWAIEIWDGETYHKTINHESLTHAIMLAIVEANAS